ncbi:hypothetical protein GCM10009865_23840 [Aeromicrobium ponti]|uniref:Flagellar hook-length control protein FliK n=1 Tax=Cytobacillus oceanisediminis TaxID=665099 RepID=A0A562JVY8_9BACI|nr:hypothetical protein [Cytobacillus oceanisediminis]TWH87337.1 hypothetical protein IQ19_02287 [Cytobacillus oceanisediminis]
MKPSEMIKTLIRQDQGYSGKSVSFRPGQIVSGKIVKLFPNQTAEVQIGSHKAIAQLETPLSANSRYWFKVQPGEGMIRLKVMESGGQASMASPVVSLLAQLALPASKDNKLLLQYFLKEQLPITGETLQLASDWLKEGESFEDGLRTVKELIVRQLPFTKDVFLALSSVNNGESVSVLMEKLLHQLNQSELTARGQKISILLNDFTQTAREKSGGLAAARLSAEWLSTKSQANSLAAFNILKALELVKGETNEEMALKQAIDSWSQRNHIPGQPAIMESIKELLQTNQSEKRQEFILNLAKLSSVIDNFQVSSGQSQALSEIQRILSNIRTSQITFPVENKMIVPLVKEAMFLNMKNNSNSGNRFLSIFGESELKIASVTLGRFLAGENNSLAAMLQPQERSILADLKNSIQAESIFNVDQQSIKAQLKNLIQALGLSHEHDMVHFLKQPEDGSATKWESLKPLLIGLLSEAVPFSAKDAAERLLHKITGFQALSQEAGPQQHFVFQLPVPLWGKVSDLTMQWSGRKTENGDIDPSHCRVLFYLNLEHLNETIVDLHVQNRIINISVINEHEGMKALAAPLTVKLKESLAKLNYKLSSVTYHKPETSGNSLKNREPISSLVEANQFTGVDLRV